MSSFRYQIQHPIRWSDVDAFGVVNNAVYFTLAEQARYEYFRWLDLLENQDFPFVLGATAARFDRPARVGTTVVIAARTTRLGGKSLDMEYEVRCEDEVLATIAATLVYVDADLRPREIPEEARTRISQFEGIPPRAS